MPGSSRRLLHLLEHLVDREAGRLPMRCHHANRVIRPGRRPESPDPHDDPHFARREAGRRTQRGDLDLGGPGMVLADYTFLDAFWSLLVFFLWVAWFILLFHIVADVFRRRDASGAKKTIWLLFILFVPFLGVFAYLIVNSDDMARRNVEQAAATQRDMDEYVRSVASEGGAAAEIERAKGLLDSGAITQQEFEAIKAKALAPA
jgi:Phospholipase_D-nuclease N-terminal/Short C-terminal domain